MAPTVCLTSAELPAEASMSIVRQRFIQCAESAFELEPDPFAADVHIHVGTPHAMPPRRASGQDSRFVFYTFAEATRIPASWVATLNQCDQVWVPTQFVRDALRDSGVCRPLRVVPLGVNCPAEPIQRVSDGPTEVFTWMWQGARLRTYRNGQSGDGDRKRGDLVERAFRQAALPNSRLILKYLPIEGVSYDFRTGPVWYVCKSLSARELDDLDTHVDVFIWPTMGEGFGLPPLEKLAKGIPAIATYWSGPREYQQDFPLPRLRPDRLQLVRFNGAPADMAEIDQATLVALMRSCYEQRVRLRGMRPELHAIAQGWDVSRRLRPRLIEAIRHCWANRSDAPVASQSRAVVAAPNHAGQ